MSGEAGNDVSNDLIPKKPSNIYHGISYENQQFDTTSCAKVADVAFADPSGMTEAGQSASGFLDGSYASDGGDSPVSSSSLPLPYAIKKESLQGCDVGSLLNSYMCSGSGGSVSASSGFGVGSSHHRPVYSRKGRRYKLWTKEQMERAIRLVVDHGYKRSRAAAVCGVPESSLREHVNRRISRGEVILRYSHDLHSDQAESEGLISYEDIVRPRSIENSEASGVVFPTSMNTGDGHPWRRLAPVVARGNQIGAGTQPVTTGLPPLLPKAATAASNAVSSHVAMPSLSTQSGSVAASRSQMAESSSQPAAVYGSVGSTRSDDVWKRLHAKLGNAIPDNAMFLRLYKRAETDACSMGDTEKSAASNSRSESADENAVTSTRSPPSSELPDNLDNLTSSSHAASEIAILQTGGTIDKDYPRGPKAYAFEIGAPASKRVMERAVTTLNVQYLTVCRKDSMEITNADIALLCKACRESRCERILITHGTDTMLDTAAILASAKYAKTIILTGAFRPEALRNSDADFNVGFALGALQCLQETGVFVAMNGRIFRWDSVKRHPTSGHFIPK